MNTLGFFAELNSFVEMVLRGRKVGARRTVEESVLDLMPGDAREIVYGLAFSRWNGAKLRTFTLLAGRRWYALFFKVMNRRLETMRGLETVEAEYEREALLDVVADFKVLHPEWSNDVDMLLNAHRTHPCELIAVG